MTTTSSVFLVTGAASGIGRALTNAIMRRGGRVVATDLAEAELTRVAQEDAWDSTVVRQVRLDVRSPEDWRRALDEGLRAFGRVDVLLNVAGYLLPGRTVDATPSDVDRHLDVNVKGVIHGMRTVGSYFVREKRGHIVNFGSLASLAPVPGLSLYTASKFAVRGISLAVAQELEPEGVAVTVVMPDAVQTPMLDLQVDHPEAAMTFSGSRALTTDEIVNVVLDDVLVNRPLEIAVPRSRGFIARAANVFPATVSRLGPALAARGRAAQARIRRLRART